MSAKEAALKAFTGAHGILLKDLNALPEEAITKSWGGKSRTVADIIYEIVQVNQHLGATIRGEDPGAWPFEMGTWITAPADVQSKDAVIASLTAINERLISDIEGSTDEAMAESVVTEHGSAPRIDRYRFLAMHMMYHSGQLNFMQAMLGDDAWHW